MERKDEIIDILIVGISTAAIPNLLLYIMQININIAVLSSVICVVVLIILKLLQHIQELKVKQNKLGGKYKKFRLYAINGRKWAEEFRNSDIRVDECVILIRKYIYGLGNKQRYEAEKNESIECWKDMVGTKIKHLKVYEYDHLSDHYYALFDEDVLMTGLNNFEKLDSTGQYGDRKPQYISGNKSKELINKYSRNFENYQEYYSKNKVYDSESI